MYLILLKNTFEQLKKKNSQLTRNRCRGEKMYSCLGEYWEEALAYIVILAYFLWGRGGTTEESPSNFPISAVHQKCSKIWFLEEKYQCLEWHGHWSSHVLTSKVNLSLTKVGWVWDHYPNYLPEPLKNSQICERILYHYIRLIAI